MTPVEVYNTYIDRKHKWFNDHPGPYIAVGLEVSATDVDAVKQLLQSDPFPERLCISVKGSTHRSRAIFSVSTLESIQNLQRTSLGMKPFLNELANPRNWLGRTNGNRPGPFLFFQIMANGHVKLETLPSMGRCEEKRDRERWLSVHCNFPGTDVV